ncbi:YceD family protein [Dichotomicrobium thermohalophilum]|uniref:Uncharacterized metal-binding protein YceD (DUF177 family) n=1 Tax=Dichotomicrobium thermohalophilum TaxID=933063 RepID=A0A397QA08_9HYPH|nr:YceD family protein [Dichotomicrobium thermohalophilum]RIA56347.1 uncharacterized metal-binding protein YceD (DUF177 family) [Dichotomicrobium thermohalophilum]
MPETDNGAILSRALDTGDIPPEGVEGHIEASADERAALAQRLDLAALDKLVFSYKVTPTRRGRFRLTGHWHAEATQTCGVTLEPIAREFDEDVSIEFWPPEIWEQQVAESGEVAVEPEEEGPEMIEEGVIDPGQLLEELLSVSLPPFPRRENAELEWEETVSKPESPFAVLKDLPKRNGGTA